jgi:pyruvate formate lyase activating enzyme
MIHDALGITERIEAYEARYWRRLDDGRIECELCPRLCKLQDGQQAPCMVRTREGDHLTLTAYGRASGFSLDPIEKKPLFHFLPGTPVLSFGTVGCNLACKFCQNWEISRVRALARLTERASPEAIARTAESVGCPSIAFTYNDPVIVHEYAIDVAAAARARGIKTVAVSAGYVRAEPRAEFYRFIDAANIDLKAFSERFYRTICAGHLEPVLETLVYLKRETKVWVEVTNLLIPGLNDSDREIDALTGWVAGTLGADVPIHFTAFHPDWRMGDRPATPAETLARARRRAIANGVRYAYTGNLWDPKGNSTSCPDCGTPLIGRDGYRIAEWNLTEDGLCPGCGTAPPGVFEATPGDWGARRRSVALARENRC